LVQNRQSTVAVDGIYSVLGLLSYGKENKKLVIVAMMIKVKVGLNTLKKMLRRHYWK
jgi:hypothetical protein